METKICSKCKVEKTIEEFSDKIWCKTCCAAYQRAYRVNHLEKMREYQKNYHPQYEKENKKKLQEYRKKWYIKKKAHIDEALKFYKEYKTILEGEAK